MHTWCYVFSESGAGTGAGGQDKGDFHAPCCPGDRENTRLSFWTRKRARALRQHLFHDNAVAKWKSDNSALPAWSKQHLCTGLGAGSDSSPQCMCISPDSALSTLYRPQKRLAGICPLSPKKLEHSTYKPHCFTWTSNFWVFLCCLLLGTLSLWAQSCLGHFCRY